MLGTGDPNVNETLTARSFKTVRKINEYANNANDACLIGICAGLN